MMYVPAPRLVCVELNPGPKPGKKPKSGRHLSEEDRWRIVFLRNDVNLSLREIAQRIPTTQATILSVLKKYTETGTVHDRPRSASTNLPVFQ